MSIMIIALLVIVVFAVIFVSSVRRGKIEAEARNNKTCPRCGSHNITYQALGNKKTVFVCQDCGESFRV